IDQVRACAQPQARQRARPRNPADGHRPRRRGDRMKRRTFIGLLGGAAVFSVRAQSPAKAYRVGFLGVFSHAEYQSLVDALRGRLRQLGYEEGKNLIIEYRWADGRYDQLPRLAGELGQINIDVIVTPSTPRALAGQQATPTAPNFAAPLGAPPHPCS